MALTREDKALSPFNEHIAALRSILSDEGVQVGADAAAYEEGARFDRGVAAFVLRPTSTAEVSAAVSYCVRNEIPIVPQAGNTGVVSGSTPDASGTQAVLSLDRLSPASGYRQQVGTRRRRNSPVRPECGTRTGWVILSDRFGGKSPAWGHVVDECRRRALSPLRRCPP